MPKSKSKQPSSDKNFILIAFVVLKYILILIGSLPINFFYLTKSLLFSLKVPRFKKFNLKLRAKPTAKRGRPKVRKLTIRLRFGAGMFLSVLGVAAYTIITLKTAYELPSPGKLTQYQTPLTTEFYDRNGKLLYRLYEGRNRSLINLEDVPLSLVQATIAIEDKNFYHHFGFDPIGITRATWHNFQNSDESLQGASTITQQLIKNTILNSERTYSRKIKEIVLSVWTEAIYSKQDILKMYFNESPYGGPFWGVEAASQGYFNKSAADLTLAESAYLAGLPASPTQYSPHGTKPELGKARQLQVLRRMREDGYISADQEREAGDQELQIQPQQNNIKAAHFVMYVKDLLSKKYGPRVVSQGGLKIYTSLDYALQEKTEDIVSTEIDSLAYLNVKNGAALVTDPQTGQILAMVGSRDYHYPGFGNYNSTITLRQPGSSIKPLTYAAAFEKGLSPGNTVLDAPITFKDPWGLSYTPVNYDGKFHGPITVRTALGSSYNIPAVETLSKVGIDDMIAVAKKLGITTFNDRNRYGLSITLGAAEVRMTDLVTAYGTFSQNGIRRTLTPILKVTDSSGNVLEEYENDSKQVMKPEVAYLITSVLSDNNARAPAFGSNSLLNIPGFDVAVKTGTSDNKRDNWTIGYTPDYVVGVWVGNPDNTKMDPQLSSGVTGAAPIWNKIMHTLLDGHINIAFEKPNGIVNVAVEGRRDIAIADYVKKQSQIRADIRSGKAKYDRSAFNIFAATYSAIQE